MHDNEDNFALSLGRESAADMIESCATADYPVPKALLDEELFIWDEDDLAIRNYASLGRRLAHAGDLYRRPAYAGGLLLAAKQPKIEPTVIDTGKRLAAVIVDRVRVRVVKQGNAKGNAIAAAHLDTMLRSEVFLQEFRPVDDVVKVAHYLPNFEVLKSGYNDGGFGMRLLYGGPEVRIEPSPKAITSFLDVMAFATTADRTNAVGAALTMLLRHSWHGAKPLIAVTSTKSHGGKDTIVQFAAGATPKLSVSYETADWAFEKAFNTAVKAVPDVGVINVENARLDRRSKFIASAFLERFLTDPAPLLCSPGTGSPARIKNNLVVSITTNEGTLSEDLMNRALPIHLDPVGDVGSRESPIGNPKLEFLPGNRERIEAELRGMVENWKLVGKSLDMDARHPFIDWARTVGGILLVNGFTDFLANYSLRKTADDPLRKALGLLGTARPDQWDRADTWARLAVSIGVKAVIPEHDRDTDKGRERGIGVVLSAHRNETFEVETDDEKLTLKLQKARRRFDGGEPSTRYCFTTLTRSALPEDPD